MIEILLLNMDRAQHFYSRPSYVGGSFPVYSGSRRQSGGSVFGAIGRSVAPAASTIGKTLGREALGFVGDVAHDVADGSSFKDALKARAKERIQRTLERGIQSGVQKVATAAMGDTVGPIIGDVAAVATKRLAPMLGNFRALKRRRVATPAARRPVARRPVARRPVPRRPIPRPRRIALPRRGRRVSKQMMKPFMRLHRSKRLF